MYQKTYLSIFIGFQTKQTPNLLVPHMDYSSAYKIIRIGINTIQKLHSESDHFSSCSLQIHWLRSFKDFLRSLLIGTEIRNSDCKSVRKSRLSLSLRSCTYFPKFFHLAKKLSPFISVGSKNLFKVNGSLMVIF